MSLICRLILALFAMTAAARPALAAEAGGDNFRLVVLGTGTPNADPDRSGPALAVIVDGKPYLVDAGPGVVRRAAAAERGGEAALDPEKLDAAFLTHLHSDHTLGLPDLFYTPWVLERAAPLRLFGPPGARKMAAHIQKAYAADIELRLHGLQPATPEGWKVEVTEIKSAGRVLEEGALSVDAIAVPHGSWKQAYGYKFAAHGKTIVISGDTARSEAILEAARGADILVHEVISAEGLKTRTPDWQAYHRSFHTTTTELAEIAREAKPKLLVLYHQLYQGGHKNPDGDAGLVAEIRAAGYEGEIVSAKDLDVFEP
ncbi:MAG: MBL fold metallo-hydrolase [Parvularculaceae bacterium]